MTFIINEISGVNLACCAVAWVPSLYATSSAISIPTACAGLTANQISSSRFGLKHASPFSRERTDEIFPVAAKISWIHPKNQYQSEVIRSKLAIETNIIHYTWKKNIKRMLCLGSSCIYPGLCPKRLNEKYLLTGPLARVSRPYALPKIAATDKCWSAAACTTPCLAVRLADWYGPGDKHHPERSHVISALIRFGRGGTQADSPIVT